MRACYSKRRRDDRQPINADLATVLVPWLEGKAKGKPVFTMPPMNHLAAIVLADFCAPPALRIALAHRIKETRITPKNGANSWRMD